MFVVHIERWPAILVDKKEPELWIAILILNNSQKWAILRASSKADPPDVNYTYINRI